MKAIILSFLFSVTAFAQEFEKKIDETVSDFGIRCSPDRNWEFESAVETDHWNNTDNPIFAFYSDKETKSLNGYAFVKRSGNLYTRLLIDQIKPERTQARVKDLFLWNVDDDPQDELVILYSWNQNNLAPRLSGNLYQVRLYQDFSSDNLNALDKIDSFKYFPGEFEGTNDSGERVRAKYTNSKKIIKRLRRLKKEKVSW